MTTQMFGEDEYLARTLDKIAAAAKDRHGPLKAVCLFTRPKIKSSHDDMSPADRANLCFYPLKLAIETREEALVSTAIDCLEKLLAHGFTSADTPYQVPAVPSGESKRSFFGGGESSKGVAASPQQASSQRATNDHGDLLMGQVVNTVCNCLSSSEDIQLQVIRVLLTSVSTPSCALHGSMLLTAIRTIYNIYLQTRSVPTQTTAKASLSQIVGIAFSRWDAEVGAAKDSMAASSSNPDAPSSPPSTTLTTEPSSPDASLKKSPSEDLSYSDVESEDGRGKKFKTVNERDCYLIFGSLCSLSIKSDDVVAVDTPEMRSKLLSLSLLQNILINSGDDILGTPLFAQLLKKFWRSLLQNCVNPLPEVGKASFRLFTHLIINLRGQLRSEIGVFFYNVIFPLLESHSTSFGQKLLTLRTLQAIGEDSQLLADLYVNYDCAIGAKPLVEQLINRVSKVVQTQWVAPNWITAEQEVELKQMSLRILSTLIRFMTNWFSKHTPVSSSSPVASGGGMEETGESEAAREASAVDADFERLRTTKKEYELVVMAFNEKPKSGIAMAVQRGLIKDPSPIEIAGFLETPGLNKLTIGEFLAKPDQKDILVAFIRSHRFSGLTIDEAMRQFLGKFKIVGEAQVVDRTMEAFAEHYCAENPEAFSSAGTAYVLAFAIMMLNTDAHSINIKPENKMDLAGFLRNVRGIDDGKDLPPTFLEGIYWRIKSSEIKLQGDSNVPHVSTAKAAEASGSDSIFLSEKKRKEMDCRLQSSSIAKASLEVIGGGESAGANHPFVRATSLGVATAMWEVAWIPTLAALSMPLEESDAPELIDVCLEGFAMATHLCCLTNSTTERAAFISSLSTFTHLTSFREIGYKNVKSIVTLLTIANREADSLQSSWYDVLKCISLLDKLHLAGTSRADLLTGRERALSTRSAELKKVEQHNAEMIQRHIDQTAVEKLFANSNELSGEAIVYLVEALCKISIEELGESQMRSYSLQKLVEVAEQNVMRMRYVWSQMWHYLSAHFISTGLSRNRKVAMFATDNLRQLAMKFLQREELGNFNFQRDFLKPFDVIATQSSYLEIREHVIASIRQMVLLVAPNILSGWKVILSVLSRFARETHVNVLVGAFEVLELIVRSNVFHLANRDAFAELINTTSRFADNVCSADVAKKSIDFLKLLAQLLVYGIPSAQHPAFRPRASRDEEERREGEGGDTAVGVPDDRAPQRNRLPSLSALIPNGSSPAVKLLDASGGPDMNLWLCLFAGLSSLAGAQSVDIALEAIDTLFELILQVGPSFTHENLILVVTGTVHPIVENAVVNLNILNIHSEQSERMVSHASVTVKRTLQNYVEFVRHFAEALVPIRTDIVAAFMGCYRTYYVHIASIGDETIRSLLIGDTSADGEGPAIALSDSEFRVVLRKLLELVEILTMSDDPVPPAILGQVARLCGSLVDVEDAMHVDTRRGYLGCIKNIIMFCQLRLDCGSVPSSSPTAIQDRPALCGLQLAAYEAAFETLFAIGDDNLFAEWGTDVLRRHRRAAAKSEIGENSEASVLAQVCGGFLSALSELDDALFLMICATAFGLLCDAISSCDPVICDPLVGVMKKYGRLKLGTLAAPSSKSQAPTHRDAPTNGGGGGGPHTQVTEAVDARPAFRERSPIATSDDRDGGQIALEEDL